MPGPYRMDSDGPKILLREENPYGTRVATVESDGRTVYLYLAPTDENLDELRAVWVRNLAPAPDQPDRESMRLGQAPLLHAGACKHPDGLSEPERTELDLVWFQEGTGVTLYRDGQIEAILPPWSGENDLQGYAREALAADAGTVPLPGPSSALYERLKENLSFWDQRAKPEHWPAFRDRLLAHYEQSYGPHLQYYALQDRTYPPLAVVEFAGSEGGRTYVTLGMSNQHMPGVERRQKEPEKHLRVEIVGHTGQAQDWYPGLLARVALYPWLSGRALADGDSFDSGLPYEEASFIFSDNFDSGPSRPQPLLVDDRYQVRFLRAYSAPQEFLLIARTRGADFALRKLQMG